MDVGLQWALRSEDVNEINLKVESASQCISNNRGMVILNYDHPAKRADLSVYVHPQYRGSGAGFRLVRMGIREAWESGMEKVSMYIFSGNPFYKSPERVAKLLPAVVEGNLKRHQSFKGQIHDVLILAVYKENQS